jgi:lipopolysaccharide assembly protein A
MAIHQPQQSAQHSSKAEPSRTTPVPRRAVTTPPHSRAGAAWVGICVAALVLTGLVVFMMQNTQPVSVTFFSLQGTVPLAIALLIAGIGVSIVALVIGTIRISQLRRRLAHEQES